MKIIGLCGGSGSGKGAVAKILSEYGIVHIDTDAIYHEITAGKSACLDALSREFGDTIITADGALNRPALAKIVFVGDGAEKRREALNRISHHYILIETKARIADAKKRGAPAALVDAPLLFESGFDGMCDAIICVIADREVRIERITERDNMTREAAEQRIDSQLCDGYLTDHSDYTVVNNGDLTALSESVSKIADKILNK